MKIDGLCAGTADRVSRRSAVLALLAAVPGLSQGTGRFAGRTWKLAQTTALSGPLGDLGTAMHSGAKACVEAVNAAGGVHGVPLELVTLDDGYDVKRSLANVDEFLKDPTTFALFSCMGTPAVTAMLPKVIDSGVPFFSPFTGAVSARPKGPRNIFYIRASYWDEAGQLVRHLATVGIKRIVVAHQNNAYGLEVVQGAQAAMVRFNLPTGSTVPVNTNSSNVAEAVGAVVDSSPEAVIVGVAGQPAIDFIKALRHAKRGLSLYTTSVLGAEQTIAALGDDGIGLTICQVVPSPRSQLAVVRDFRTAWSVAGFTNEPSHLALEGYINARAFVVALKRAGASATPKSFIDSTWTTGRHDLGGFDINFAEPGRAASKYVDLTMIGRNGRLLR